MCAQSLRLFVTPWTVAFQAPLPKEFSRQKYWSGLSFSTPGDISNLGIEPASLASPALAGGFFTTVPPGKPQWVRGGGESHWNLQCIARRSEAQVAIYTWDWPLKWAGVGVGLGGLIWCCLQVVSELSWIVGHPPIWWWRSCFVGLETPYMWIGIKIATNKSWFLPFWSRNLEKRKSTRTRSQRRSKVSSGWSV